MQSHENSKKFIEETLLKFLSKSSTFIGNVTVICYNGIDVSLYKNGNPSLLIVCGIIS